MDSTKSRKDHAAITRFVDALSIRKVPGIGKVEFFLHISILCWNETFQACQSLPMIYLLCCLNWHRGRSS